MATVPVEYLGVWKRTLLKTKSGTHDTTSEAYWLQTGHLHCDVRVPTNAQKVSSIPLAECSDDELHALASQYAFAGHTKVTKRLQRAIPHLLCILVTIKRLSGHA